MPKVQYSCTGIKSDGTICGELSAPKYPSKFTQSREKYLCCHCAQIISHNTPKYKKQQSELRTNYYKLHPEARDKISIAQTKRWKDIGARQKQSESHKIVMNLPEVKQRMSESQIKRFKDPKERKRNRENKQTVAYKQNASYRSKKAFKSESRYEHHIIARSGQGFWYGHPIIRTEHKKKRYCELWNRLLWVRIDAAWDYKSAISQKTRWENHNQKHLDRHHVYWQERACCEWDEDAQGYFAMINNGSKANPDIIKYYIKGDPNKFVLLTHDEHMMIRGSKKSGKDKIYWVKYFEDLILKREAEGKKCYLSVEEYTIYKLDHADTIAYYTQNPHTPPIMATHIK